MHVSAHSILRIAACLSAACLTVSCRSSDARAQDALGAYQAAAASNDLVGARKALVQLVSAKGPKLEMAPPSPKPVVNCGSKGPHLPAIA